MKFTAALFAAGAMAAQLASRQASVVQDAISAIQSGTEALGSATSSFEGAEQVVALQSAAADLLSTIQAQTENVAAINELTVVEAAPLANAIGGLADATSSATQAAIAKKPTFVSVGVGEIVYNTLVQLRDAANQFAETTTSKVPASLRDLANSLSAPIIANLDSAVQEFADQAGSGGSPSGSPSASESASPSTTAAPSGSSSAAPSTTAAPSGSATTTKAPVATYTGAAVANAAGFGAVAMAAAAVVAAL